MQLAAELSVLQLVIKLAWATIFSPYRVDGDIVVVTDLLGSAR
jgi:hypothetical protein